MRICIFGAGAVGSHLAVRLALAGHDVCCVMRGPHLEAVKARGLVLRVGDAEFPARVKASDDPVTLGPQDLVISTLKATGVSSLATGLRPLLRDDTAVVFAQNGIPWWYDIGLAADHPPPPDLAFLDPGGRLRAAVAKEHIIGGVIFSSNEIVAPGQRADRTAARHARCGFDRLATDAADQGDDLVQAFDQHVDVGAVPVDRPDCQGRQGGSGLARYRAASAR
jgi:2-dehydropantoate 2-reductase